MADRLVGGRARRSPRPRVPRPPRLQPAAWRLDLKRPERRRAVLLVERHNIHDADDLLARMDHLRIGRLPEVVPVRRVQPVNKKGPRSATTPAVPEWRFAATPRSGADQPCERIDLAAKELAEVSARLQAAADAAPSVHLNPRFANPLLEMVEPGKHLGDSVVHVGEHALVVVSGERDVLQPVVVEAGGE
jgi:hypothetical protein